MSTTTTTTGTAGTPTGPTVTPIINFRTLHDQTDLTANVYLEVNKALYLNAETGYSHSSTLALLGGAGPDIPIALLGLFPYGNEAHGRTRCIVGVGHYQGGIGTDAALRDKFYGFVDDVTPGGTPTAPTVKVSPDFFLLTDTSGTRVHANVTELASYLNAMGTNQVSEPLADTVGEVRYIPYMTVIPPPLVSAFLGQRVKPIQAVKTIFEWMVTTRNVKKCSYLFTWCSAAAQADSQGGTHSSVLQGLDVESPVADRGFMAWRQRELAARIQNLPTSTGTSGFSTSHIATIMADMLQEQRGLRTDTAAARTAASAPKTPAEHFRNGISDKLMFLTNALTTADMPEVWQELASAGGKRGNCPCSSYRAR